jgi:hypothetical protein
VNNKEAKAPVPFSVMTGDSELFIANDKKYNVKPMLIGDALKFTEDNLSIGSQIFNIGIEANREKIESYLKKYCTNDKGDEMSVESVVADEWSVVDLKNFVRKLCDISG